MRQAKLVRSSRWKSGPSKGQRPLGSECCVATGDSGCEAYTAIAWGVGLSHERSYIAGAEGFHSLEGNMCGTAMRGADALPGSKATSRAKGSYRNLGDLVSGRQALRERDGPHREGEEPKPMMHGREKSDPAIVAVKPANKAKEAHCGGICGGGRSGVGGAKGGGQGECAPAKHVLGSEPGSRVTGAGAYTATLPSHTRGGSRMRESRTYGSVRGASMKIASLPLLDRRTLLSTVGLWVVSATSGAFAQQQRLWRVGFLALPERPDPLNPVDLARSREACATLATSRAENLLIEWRFAGGEARTPFRLGSGIGETDSRYHCGRRDTRHQCRAKSNRDNSYRDGNFQRSGRQRICRKPWAARR